MFLCGINHVLFHGTCYSPADAEWPGWQFYASVEFAAADADLARPAGDERVHRARASRCCNRGKPDNDVLLYWPIHDLWMRPDGHGGPLHDAPRPTPLLNSAVRQDRAGPDHARLRGRFHLRPRSSPRPSATATRSSPAAAGGTRRWSSRRASTSPPRRRRRRSTSCSRRRMSARRSPRVRRESHRRPRRSASSAGATRRRARLLPRQPDRPAARRRRRSSAHTARPARPRSSTRSTGDAGVAGHRRRRARPPPTPARRVAHRCERSRAPPSAIRSRGVTARPPASRRRSTGTWDVTFIEGGPRCRRR